MSNIGYLFIAITTHPLVLHLVLCIPYFSLPNPLLLPLPVYQRHRFISDYVVLARPHPLVELEFFFFTENTLDYNILNPEKSKNCLFLKVTAILARGGELHWGGSTTNGATPSSFLVRLHALVPPNPILLPRPLVLLHR